MLIKFFVAVIPDSVRGYVFGARNRRGAGSATVASKLAVTADLPDHYLV